MRNRCAPVADSFTFGATRPLPPKQLYLDVAEWEKALLGRIAGQFWPYAIEGVEGKTIEAMRESHAQLQPVAREARSGEIVTVDIDVTVDAKTLPPFARQEN